MPRYVGVGGCRTPPDQRLIKSGRIDERARASALRVLARIAGTGAFLARIDILEHGGLAIEYDRPNDRIVFFCFASGETLERIVDRK